MPRNPRITASPVLTEMETRTENLLPCVAGSGGRPSSFLCSLRKRHPRAATSTTASLRRIADPANEDDSKRPRETIEPLSAFGPELTTPAAKTRLTSRQATTAEGGGVLISWEHKRIPRLARILVSGTQSIPDWPDDRFDMLWVFDRSGAAWSLTQVPQLLLAGDCPDLLPNTSYCRVAQISWPNWRKFTLEIANGEN